MDVQSIDWGGCPSLATHWDTMRQWWVAIGNRADDPVMIFDEGAPLAGWQPRCWLKTGQVIADTARFVRSPLDPNVPPIAEWRHGVADGIEKTAIPAVLGGASAYLQSN